MKVIRLIGLVNGEPSEFDETFVVAYDPSYWPRGEPYDGGLLEVTKDAALAKHFPSAKEAMECWQQTFGVREDGKPNRPLTAWTACIEDAPVTVVR